MKSNEVVFVGTSIKGKHKGERVCGYYVVNERGHAYIYGIVLGAVQMVANVHTDSQPTRWFRVDPDEVQVYVQKS